MLFITVNYYLILTNNEENKQIS